jgi:beta-phosphoglucomutase
MALQAVIFDMDGVLADTVEYHYLSWVKICREYGIPFEREDNDKLLGLTRQRSLEKILGERSLTEAQVEDILQRKNQYFLEMIAEMTAADLLPGAHSLVEELHAAGLRLAVASASRNAELILERSGIRDYLDAVVDGSQNLRSKPWPDAYIAAATAIETTPEDCLAVEDSPAGIEAALAAGMCVVGIGQPQLVGQAHAVLPGLEQVRVVDLAAIHRWWHAAHVIPRVGVFDNIFAG